MKENLSEQMLRDMRPVSQKDCPLLKAEEFSLLPPKLKARDLEKKAIQLFELPNSISIKPALDFVARDLGLREVDLRKEEVLLAVHYISLYGGGYNSRIDRIVIDLDPQPENPSSAQLPPVALPAAKNILSTGRGSGVGGGIHAGRQSFSSR